MSAVDGRPFRNLWGLMMGLFLIAAAIGMFQVLGWVLSKAPFEAQFTVGVELLLLMIGIYGCINLYWFVHGANPVECHFCGASEMQQPVRYVRYQLLGFYVCLRCIQGPAAGGMVA